MASDSTPPLPANLPPSLPSSLPAADRRGVVVDGRVVPGTENLTATDIAEEVLAGGRFVTFRYCVSIIILTFLRPTGIVFLKRNEDAGKHAFGWSFLTLFAGWWGFPWGPIYTIGSLITNARGGKDLTREVLHVVLPDSAVEPLMKQRRPPSAGPLLWALRAVLIAGPLMLIGMDWGLGPTTAAKPERNNPPGYAAFDAAHRATDQSSPQIAGGNTAEAKTIAADFCSSMENLRKVFFVQKGGSSSSSEPKPFHTWCEMHGDSCLLLVHVPDLRKFDSKSKGAICEMAWGAAQGAAGKRLAAGHSGSLAVGVRGFALYERLMEGTLKADGESDAPATSVDDHSEIRRQLQERFAVATTAR